LASAARNTVWTLNPNLPVVRLRTGEAVLAESTARTGYTMLILAIAAAVALALGAIGIYGVISCIVSQRTREIGVRMALGAARSDVSRMVVSQGLKLALAGVALGVLGALAAARVMTSLLFGVAPTDPITFIATALFLLAVTVVATYIPARRAASMNPVNALHYE
jgi:ABC-type antimicrobial peptide transport system permease subunit